MFTSTSHQSWSIIKSDTQTGILNWTNKSWNYQKTNAKHPTTSSDQKPGCDMGEQRSSYWFGSGNKHSWFQHLHISKRNLNLHTWLNGDGCNLLDNIRLRVQINEALVDSHPPAIPCVVTFTKWRLAHRQCQDLGRQTNRSGDVKLLDNISEIGQMELELDIITQNKMAPCHELRGSNQHTPSQETWHYVWSKRCSSSGTPSTAFAMVFGLVEVQASLSDSRPIRKRDYNLQNHDSSRANAELIKSLEKLNECSSCCKTNGFAAKQFQFINIETKQNGTN